MCRNTGPVNRRLQVRVLPGEANFKPLGSRYLIDFITGISDVSSGLAALDSDPGMDSNLLFSDQHSPSESALVHN
jgi:hypothetical protein